MSKGLIGLVAGGLAAILLGITSCTTVPARHIGVKDTFGEVSEYKINPGISLVNPFSKVVRMDCSTKTEKEDNMPCPTKGGVRALLDVTINYHLNPERVVEVYKRTGPNYEEALVIAPFRNLSRQIVSGYEPEEVQQTKREEIQGKIYDNLLIALESDGIVLENVYLRDVDLPETITDAINRKVEAKQDAERMQYILQKETQEATRRLTEAGGIVAAQEKLREALTPQYIQWRYIAALEEIAKSPNTSVIVVPYDKGIAPTYSLPLPQILPEKK